MVGRMFHLPGYIPLTRLVACVWPGGMISCRRSAWGGAQLVWYGCPCPKAALFLNPVRSHPAPPPIRPKFPADFRGKDPLRDNDECEGRKESGEEEMSDSAHVPFSACDPAGSAFAIPDLEKKKPPSKYVFRIS